MSISTYPLKHSAILDTGTTLHVFNELSRFLNFRIALYGDFLWAGDTRVPIQGYGEIDIHISDPGGIMRLEDVALCENFASNLVSYRKLEAKGLWWDTRTEHKCLRRVSDQQIVARLIDKHHQYVLELISEDLSRRAFFVRRRGPGFRLRGTLEAEAEWLQEIRNIVVEFEQWRKFTACLLRVLEDAARTCGDTDFNLLGAYG
jgi:hypothetical protein